MNQTNQAVVRRLSAFADHVGPAPEHAALTPAIMMPMHIAIDGYAFSVIGPDARIFFLKIYAEDSLPSPAWPVASHGPVMRRDT